MGLFDKKTKKGEGGNGIDEEHPSATTSQPIPVPVTQSAPVRAAPPPPPPPSVERSPDYGINKAIELMRHLPDDNMELVVLVVKTTLESANVKVTTIIDDAVRKQGQLETRMSVLAREVAALESEVATRKREIAALEADYKETSTVKDWLVVAETQGRSESAKAPEAAQPAQATRPADAADKA